MLIAKFNAPIIIKAFCCILIYIWFSIYLINIKQNKLIIRPYTFNVSFSDIVLLYRYDIAKSWWPKCKACFYTCTRFWCRSERFKKQFLTEVCWTLKHQMQWLTVNRTTQQWDKSVFTGYTFVRGRRQTKHFFQGKGSITQGGQNRYQKTV